ncbi:uncharacterized protein LOC122025722 [Zingiber officinale]|uniref:RIN4 pathogenic type III effector avirulence factor Avr cleavage site domain-containing protein n=1 Tax=Zingiber officinale TaxID=94328 RepID=A0A8J5F0W4_ZINOF|nr:uncharacterized protein LOC122021807 [Zingiber officinale]XP_042440514.1 uncharacterized protein LOC122025722 [Zingiber officinale]KAG6476712.1 hypothetical protein ZIOFF_065959 [Zingiber officinale]
MADSKEENHSTGGWMSVPAFGGWDTKNGVPDYSMDFSKIREMRKHSKNPSRASLGNEEELGKVANKGPEPEVERHRRRRSDPDSDLRHHGSPTGRKKCMGYFQCCIGA